MKKVLSVIAVAALLPFCASAEILTPQAALQRAGRSGVAKASAKATKAMELVYTENTLTKTPAVYVFQSKGDNGFLLVAADDVAVPVLGYADSGSFDEESMAPGLKAWLQDYARQIQYAVTMGAGSVPTSFNPPVVGDAVAPLVKSKWNQGYPYNLDTPKDNGENCVTGCVATAMAQVMNYWKWPAVGHGKALAYVNGIEQPSIDLAEYPFDWENMTDVYDSNSTEEQQKAVARLMLCCGFSVKMGYSSGESGAQSINLVSALVNNFDYNKNIQLLDRNFYSGSDWNRVVYEELKAGRPVLYAGSSRTGAHQFVVDGYDSEGYFHLNWGWGGSSDGYFSLNALEPGSQGIGGSAGGYNYGQSIIQGVQIEETEAEERPEVAMKLAAGGVKATVNGLRMYISSTVGSGLWNGTAETLTGVMGVMIEGVTDTSYSANVQAWSVNALQAGWGWSIFNMNDVTFPDAAPDGKYKVTVAFLKQPDMKWIPVLSPEANYFYVTKNGSILTAENPAAGLVFKVTSEVSENMYANSIAKFKFTAKNESDKEITQGVYPALYDYNGTMIYDAEGFMLTLQPGEEFTKEFSSEWHLIKDGTGIGSASSAEYIFKFFDPITNQPFADTQTYVTMKAIDFSGVKVSCSMPVFTGLTQTSISDGTNVKNGYKVPDPGNMKFKIRLTNTGTQYFGQVMRVICAKIGDSLWTYYPQNNSITLEPGESVDQEFTLDFSNNYEVNKVYLICPIFYYNDDWRWPGMLEPERYSYLIFDTSGVSDIYAEGESAVSISYYRADGKINVSSDAEIKDVKVYGIDGRALAVHPSYSGTSASVSVADLAAGVYLVTAKDAEGRTKALKIVK